MEVEADLLEVIPLTNPKSTTSYSWETDNELKDEVPQVCASECTEFPFAPELCTESLLPIKDKIVARVMRNECDLVMDFAFLLCGWESRSIELQGNKFRLRYNLSLPGVSHTIIEAICQNLSLTAEKVLFLENECFVGSKNGSIQTAFCRAIQESIRLHRTLVLKLGTVKSLPLFIKLTRRCCDGIRFMFEIHEGIDFHQNGAHLLLTLLAFSPYAHGDFEKKLLIFLLKSCSRPYLYFVKNITRGVIDDGQVEDFCGNALEVRGNVSAATGGISDILLELHKSVIQCIYNGKIIHSEIMQEAIRENIRKNQVANRLEKQILPVQREVKAPEKNKVIVAEKKEVEFVGGTLTQRSLELQEVDNSQLSASLGQELEQFYKELQIRLKAQYDLEDWKQRRTRMAAKRRGLKVKEDSIVEEQVAEDEAKNESEIPKESDNVIEKTTPKESGFSFNEEDVAYFENTESPKIEKEVKETKKDSKKVEENEVQKSREDEKILNKEAKVTKDKAKKALQFGAKDIQDPEEIKIAEQKEIESNVFDSALFKVPKDPESDFLSMLLPVKTNLQQLNATSLKVILGGMQFFDHLSTIKKLLFFQNRSIVEQICTHVQEPMGAKWKISTIIDYISRDPQVDVQLLKNVIFKPYQGITTDLALSYAVEWPMTLTLYPETLTLMEKASSFLLEIELVKWRLSRLYKDLLTSKTDYPVKIHLMIHEYVLFSSRLASYVYAQVHDECWTVFDKRISSAISGGKTLEECQKITERHFKNISTRLFLEKKALKIHETVMIILKNTSEYIIIVSTMKNETDQVALAKAFKKFHDFQTLKKFLLRVLRAINPNGCQWFDDVIS